jgi:hypothetical protein
MKATRNAGKRWTKSDEWLLRHYRETKTPTRIIGLKLGRTENAIRAKFK